MKYQYSIEEKHGKNWWELHTTSAYKSAKLFLKDRKAIRPELHHRISRRPVGKWEVVMEHEVQQ